MKLFYIIPTIILICSLSCSSLRQIRNNLFLNITNTSISAKDQSYKIQPIVMSPILSRNPGFNNISANNFTDNLKFHLIRESYSILDVPVDNEKNKSENSPSPSVLSSLIRKEVFVNDKESIAKICTESGASSYIAGYLYETKTGTVLDEEISSGVIISIYKSDGSLLTQLQFIGSISLDEFLNNSEVARVFAKKIKKIL